MVEKVFAQKTVFDFPIYFKYTPVMLALLNLPVVLTVRVTSHTSLGQFYFDQTRNEFLYLVKEDPTKGVYVDKLSRHIVTDIDEAKTLYEKGIKNR